MNLEQGQSTNYVLAWYFICILLLPRPHNHEGVLREAKKSFSLSAPPDN